MIRLLQGVVGYTVTRPNIQGACLVTKHAVNMCWTRTHELFGWSGCGESCRTVPPVHVTMARYSMARYSPSLLGREPSRWPCHVELLEGRDAAHSGLRLGLNMTARAYMHLPVVLLYSHVTLG